MNQHELVAVEHLSPNQSRILKVEWFIGLRCNFSCSYCAEWDRSGFGETEKMLKAIQLLKTRVGNRPMHLLLSGGEPSIHPHIREICRSIFEHKITLMMISNGSLKPDLYVELLQWIKQYTFSVHFEMKFEKTMATIRSVWSKMCELNAHSSDRLWTMQVNVMMVPGFFKEAKQVMAELKELGIPFIIRRVRPRFDETLKPILPDRIQDRQVDLKEQMHTDQSPTDWGYYSEDELTDLKNLTFQARSNTREFWRLHDGTIEVLTTNSNDLLLRKVNQFEHWKCWIGLERLHIYPNGDVYRNPCKVGGQLGNIYQDFTMPTEPVTCNRYRCTCAWALNVSKSKDKDAEKYLTVAPL